MNSRGRPRLYGGELARRLHISIPGELAAEVDAARKINVSEVCTSAIRRELADKVYMDAAKEIINSAIMSMEKRFDSAGLLGPEERLAFHKIRSVVWAIEGDAWIKRAKLMEISVLKEAPNNGSEKNKIPLSERKIEVKT